MQVPKIKLQGNGLEKIRDLLKIYSIVIFKQDITQRESELLSEYLAYGYCKKAQDIARMNYGISDNNIKQLNSRLQKKGLLVPKPYKQDKILHRDLEIFRKSFIEGNIEFLILDVSN